MISFYDWNEGYFRYSKYIEISHCNERVVIIADKKEKYIMPYYIKYIDASFHSKNVIDIRMAAYAWDVDREKDYIRIKINDCFL